jgi:hypothetical protein
MKTTRDWLPVNHEALYNQGTQTWTYLNTPANRARMGFSADTPQGVWIDGTFHPKHTAFATAYEDWKNYAERTPVKTALLQDSEKAFREVYRQLYTGFLKNSPLVSNEDLLEMGMPERSDGNGSSVSEPTTYVEATVTLVGPAVIDIHFRDKDSRRKGKPYGMHGVEIAWAILDAPPVNWEELIHSSFYTHSPLRKTFENDQRGKTIYFALRWENTTGEKGPWNEIQNAIIP